MNAIILDGQLKSALTAVRSLGMAGIKTYVGAERSTGMALHSKYATEKFVYPSPYTHQKEFIEVVKRQAEKLGNKPMVYAFSDATFLSLYAFRGELEAYVTLVFPDSKSVEIAFDKGATYSLARVSGIPTIVTYMPESREEVRRLGDEVTYPVVVKTRKSVTWNNGIGIFGSASFVHSKEELQERFLDLKNKLDEAPLIQDLLLGEEYGVEMLAHEGEIYARVTHHRIRSLSPTGGASVLKETLSEGALKDTLEGYAQKLVEKLSWTGPIMVEFKVDSDSREPYLMEINGRFWGSLPLSVAAGVDMPLLYYRMTTDGGIKGGMVVGRDGVASNHFLGDVRNILHVLFSRSKMRSILFPSRLRAMRDFCMLPLGTKSDVWSWSDPKPAFFEVIDIIKKTWKFGA